MAANADARVGDAAMCICMVCAEVEFAIEVAVRILNRPPGVPRTPWLGCGAVASMDGEGRLMCMPATVADAPKRPPKPMAPPVPVAEPGRSRPGLGKAAIQRLGVAGPMAGSGDCSMAEEMDAAEGPPVYVVSIQTDPTVRPTPHARCTNHKMETENDYE